jgi:hypothetical protein
MCMCVYMCLCMYVASAGHRAWTYSLRLPCICVYMCVVLQVTGLEHVPLDYLLYVCVCVCVCVKALRHIPLSSSLYMCLCVCVCVCVCVYLCVCVCVCMCVCVCVCVCVFACVCEYVYVYLCVMYVYLQGIGHTTRDLSAPLCSTASTLYSSTARHSEKPRLRIPGKIVSKHLIALFATVRYRRVLALLGRLYPRMTYSILKKEKKEGSTL